MILYHVSYKSFTIGECLTANEITPYFLEKQEKKEEWVDTILNNFKPVDAPDRQHTFFACDAIENCYAFIANKIPLSGNPIYYKVEMIEPIKAVMCITDLILKVGPDDIQVEDFAKEYWIPTLNWKYYEYLSAKMKIMEIIEEPNSLLKAKGRINYQSDWELRKNTFGK
jgi:hypothetical protein